MNRPPPHQSQSAAELTAVAAVAVVAADAADAARIFDEDVRSAVSYERGLAVKSLLALALVAAVVAARVLFLG